MKPTSDSINFKAWSFLSRWFENSKKVPIKELYEWAKKFPYEGEAYRISKSIKASEALPSSWSKLPNIEDYWPGRFKTIAIIQGIDTKPIVDLALEYSPHDNDIQEIDGIQEVIALDILEIKLTKPNALHRW